MSVVIHRLSDGARAALIAHFLELSAEDRRLRFGTALGADSIAAYVNAIDFDSDAVFAVHDDRLAVVAAAHVAFGDDMAELGLSVLPLHRARGIGGALFERGWTHVRNRFVSRLFMHCLVENAAVMHIARKARMSIVTDTGDADAYLELPPASAASITREFVADRVARYDYAFKAEAAAWARIHAALFGGLPVPALAPPRP